MATATAIWDLLVGGNDGESYYAILWINDGYGFVSSNRFVLDSKEDHFPMLRGRTTPRRSRHPVLVSTLPAATLQPPTLAIDRGRGPPSKNRRSLSRLRSVPPPCT